MNAPSGNAALPAMGKVGCSAVLLAGGQSRRMGRDKAGLPVRGRVLWEHQVATLAATGAAPIRIVGQVHGPYVGSQWPILFDQTRGAGPLAGLEVALAEPGPPWVMVLAVDLPEITPAFLQSLWREAERTGCSVIPQRGDFFEPLAAVYHRDWLPLVQAHLQTGDFSLQRLIQTATTQHRVHAYRLDPAEVGLFRNLNSPEDLPD